MVDILEGCWVRVHVAPEDAGFFGAAVQTVTHAVAVNDVNSTVFSGSRRVPEQLVQGLRGDGLLQVPISRGVDVHATCAVTVADKRVKQSRLAQQGELRNGGKDAEG